MDKLDINKYTIAKNNNQLLEIKETIMQNHKDQLEWLNIERIGMKYKINLEPKVEKNAEEKEDYCHIISDKDAIISRIITNEGMELKDINDSVKKGDIIISGDITFNEEIKERVCADGLVYGKTWYTINISTPKTYESITKQNKKRYNLVIKHDNKKYKLFKPRLTEYIDEENKIINIFGFEIYLDKEIEVTKEIKEYNDQEFENNIEKLVNDKMSSILKGDYKILDRKVLKKTENNSKIDIEIFIVAEEAISSKKIDTIETETE